MKILNDVLATRDETMRYFALSDSELARSHAPGKWSVRLILHHLADAETVFFDRICRVLSEPRQVLWAFDQDAWCAGLEYQTRPLELSRDIFQSVRNGVIHYARRHYETQGPLEFVHSETGVRTLKQEFDKVASHNETHLAQIRRALGGGLHRHGTFFATLDH